MRRPGPGAGRLNLVSQSVARGSVLDVTIAHGTELEARDCRKEAAPGIVFAKCPWFTGIAASIL